MTNADIGSRSHDAQGAGVGALVGRSPSITGEEIAAHLVPPRQFDEARFDTYRPDPEYDTQAQAVEVLRAFSGDRAGSRGGLFSRRKAPAPKPGVYLDGGFGVGKTHLLASLWHAMPGPKYFGTFIEYTALVGALGYQGAVGILRGATLVAIDEFELDDPGDTMMMTRLLSDLVQTGTRIAATSNTPPNALGEGRFAAADFLREIQAMSDRFDTIRIDGLDYRRRAFEGHAVTVEAHDLDARADAARQGGRAVTLDGFPELVAHLARLHPSKYVKLIEGVDVIALRDVTQLQGQTDALRFVAFVDRVYDAQIPLLASGTPFDEAFSAEMLAGGYRKKYLRAISRLISLTAAGRDA
ncbi:cell division protein ZapE [Clavibacter michiganensis]|uniref:Cell division protein ZapE n=1 Tax=Clavibacter michiganensis TaxID=28447 RepID=A0A2S5VPV3_9MICO|nr:cell division protein ZapE [Clavibacter michiganensis]PPF65250.1 cell division protein ZapE [Clavibacter michiganensis]